MASAKSCVRLMLFSALLMFLNVELYVPVDTQYTCRRHSWNRIEIVTYKENCNNNKNIHKDCDQVSAFPPNSDIRRATAG